MGAFNSLQNATSDAAANGKHVTCPIDPPTDAIEHGKVKWFSPLKGFGFILPDKGGADVMLHINALRGSGYNTIADDQRVLYKAMIDPNGRNGGRKATWIKMDGENLPPRLRLPPAVVTCNPIATDIEASVKWFNYVRGFGFFVAARDGQPVTVARTGKTVDVRVHNEVLKFYGITELLIPGQRFKIDVVAGVHGLETSRVKNIPEISSENGARLIADRSLGQHIAPAAHGQQL